MKSFFRLLTVAFLVVIPFLSYGPPPSGPKPPGGGAGPQCWPPPCIPIDNGIMYLVLGGFLLAIYKVVDIKRKEKI